MQLSVRLEVRWRTQPLLLDCGTLDLNGNLLADQHAAGVQRCLEVDAEVEAIDRGARFEADAGVAERVFLYAEGLHLERDGLGGGLDGQVARHRAVAGFVDIEAGRGERHLRVLLYREEVFTAYVGVAVLVVSVDARGAHGAGGRLLPVCCHRRSAAPPCKTRVWTA